LVYGDELVLLAKEETVLQCVIDRLIDIEKCYGMETNLEKNYGNEILKTTIPNTCCDRLKKLKNVEYFQNLGKLTRNYAKLYV
jgi:hypothetical protein